MVAHTKQAKAMAHLRECINAHGVVHGPAVARAKYTDVSQPSWSRWSRAVKAAIELEHSSDQTPQSDATFGDASATSVSPLDFFEGQLSDSLRDIELLRQQATMRDQNGQVRLRNPVAMASVVRLRNQMLALYVQRQDAAIGAERMASYRELVDTAIAHALSDSNDPAEAAVIRRVTDALNAAGKQWRSVQHVVDPRRAAVAAEAGP